MSPQPQPRRCPVVLCPGLGSSGAYTFDLSPVVSLADYLADRGWDVWTLELRGNAQSDKPRLFVRSRWWTIDDYVDKDVPAVLSYVRKHTGAAQVHLLGHSMGGMIATRLLALGGEAAASIRSAIIVASGCFLRSSWWRSIKHVALISHVLWAVPAGGALRGYSRVAMGRAGLRALDELLFWPPNTDPALARALLARNFNSISPGVMLQFKKSFGRRGLCTADGREPYADPARLAAIKQPVLFICGDRDRTVPAKGAAATAALFTGSACARFVPLGPRHGTRHHYGHFDILMGLHVEQEVFPRLHAWLERYDGSSSGAASGGGGGSGRTCGSEASDGVGAAAGDGGGGGRGSGAVAGAVGRHKGGEEAPAGMATA